MTSRRPYVDIPRPYEISANRFEVELSFPASSTRRAKQHHHIAAEVARIYPVEATTPLKVTTDYRRLKVHGEPRALARYLAALHRVLPCVERLATRAARAFGTWRRSLITVLSGHLEAEDPTTLRVRANEFRRQVLDTLIGYLAQGAPRAPHRDPARPLWEQATTVAAEVWQAAPVDPWALLEEEIQAQLERMRPTQLSVVEQPMSTQPPAKVPDTVHELLELSGPADQAPVEPAPVAVRALQRVAASAAAGPGGCSADTGERFKQVLAGGREPVQRQPMTGACTVPLPIRQHRPGRRRTLAEIRGKDAKRARQSSHIGLTCAVTRPLPQLGADRRNATDVTGAPGLRIPRAQDEPVAA